jgi:hypothetical protein
MNTTQSCLNCAGPRAAGGGRKLRRFPRLRRSWGCLALPLVIALALLFVRAPAAYGEETEVFTQAELDQMLAPIALYPDVLISQVLIAATYPLEVVEAARWSRANPDLAGEEAVDAVFERDWDLSVKALTAFPQLLRRMDDDLTWTRRLGDAFLLQEEQVMDTIQELRRRADAAGTLNDLDKLQVRRDREVIFIESPSTRVVYVPYYNTRVVYGPWWWDAYPPIYWGPTYGYYYTTGIVWSRGVVVSPIFYYRTSDWYRRQVVVVHHYHHHHYYRQPVSRTIVTRTDEYPRWRHDVTHRRGVAYNNDRLAHEHGRASSSGVVDRRTFATRVAERSDRGTPSGADLRVRQRNPETSSTLAPMVSPEAGPASRVRSSETPRLRQPPRMESQRDRGTVQGRVESPAPVVAAPVDPSPRYQDPRRAHLERARVLQEDRRNRTSGASPAASPPAVEAPRLQQERPAVQQERRQSSQTQVRSLPRAAAAMDQRRAPPPPSSSGSETQAAPSGSDTAPPANRGQDPRSGRGTRWR